MRKSNGDKGQSSLELAVVFVTLILFFLGMLRILFWGNFDLLQRQSDYINTRDNHGIWPMHTTRPLSDSVIFSGGY